MPTSAPRTVLITGATSAIGGALAKLYAEPGVTLFLHGRNQVKLAEIEQACQARQATVYTQSFDIRDSHSLRAWVKAAHQLMPLDLVISNAGMNTNIGPDCAGEKWEESEAVVDVNLRASMVLIDAVLPDMRRNGKGQIALLSSLAAYYGLPVTPSYCAAKAAIKAYGEALRGWLAPQGIQVNVVMPGYVDSAMCREMPGPKPFLWMPDQAAHIIQARLRRNHARITFPFPLNFGTWWLAVLPAAISQRIVQFMGYHG